MLTETQPAAVLAVDLDEVKGFLRLDDATDDALLASFVRSATELAEAFTGQILLRRDFTDTLNSAGVWTRLAATPVTAITGIDAAEGPLPGGGYETDIDAAGDGWVRIIGGPSRRVAVRFSAGMAGDWNHIPETLRLGIMRLATHLYTHRDAADAGPPPAAVAALWRPWRRVRL